MRVLVTGGAGFIGSHLCAALLGRGDDVTILDNLDDVYDPAIKAARLARLSAAVVPPRVLRADVRDPAAVGEALEGVRSVVHLAARAGVRPSLVEPALYASINVQGLVVLLDALRARPGIPLVFASSSSVYGAQERAPFSEDMPADRPLSPYAATKRAGELLCHAAQAGWGLQVTCLRFFNVYGPGQRPDMAISRFAEHALRGEPLPLYGDPGSARDYTWVGDVVEAVLRAIDRPLSYDILNVGSGQPVRLDALAAAVGRAAGVPVRMEVQQARPGDVPFTHADLRRVQRVLGWSPRVGLEEGLARYVADLRRSNSAEAR